MRIELEKRPLLVTLIALILGLVAGSVWWYSLLLLPLILFLKGIPVRAFSLGFLLLGYFLAPALPDMMVTTPSSFSGLIRLDSVPRITESNAIATGIAGGHKFLIILPNDVDATFGDLLEVQGTLKPLSQFSEERLARQGISGNLEVAKLDVKGGAPWLFRLGWDWLRSFRSFTQKNLQPEVAKLTDALCFNVDASLDKDSFQHLQRTGTIHIVSASGMHVFIFGAALALMFGKLPIRREYQLALLILVLLVYAGAAGFRPPIVRSVVMTAFFLGAYLVKRVPDPLSALAAAAMVFLLWQPASLYDIGFQLSFATVAGLALYMQRANENSTKPYLVDQIGEGLKASLVATLAAEPIVAYYFGIVSLVAIPVNMLIAAVLPMILVGSLAAWSVAPALPAVSLGVLTFAVEPFIGWVLWVTRSIGDWEFAAVPVGTFEAYWLIPYYALFLFSWRKIARRP